MEPRFESEPSSDTRVTWGTADFCEEAVRNATHEHFDEQRATTNGMKIVRS